MILNVRKDLPAMVLGTLALIVSAFLCPVNHFAVAALLMICAVAAYLYIVLVQTDRNWFDIRAIFSAIWLATLGLAALRLSGYQVEWEKKTWVCQAIAYATFHLGVSVGDTYCLGLYDKVKKYIKKHNRYQFRMHEDRLFWICVAVTLMGLVSFLMNVRSQGFIPFFVKGGGNDYLNFYTKWYIFAVAGTMISGLSYYVLKTQKLPVWKQVILWCSIIYSTFVFPILSVNRSALLTAALSLITAIFYLNKKRLGVLILCVILLAGAFAVCTNARGYSEEQLNAFFEPVQLGTEATTEPPATEPPATEPPATEPPATEPPVTEPPATEPAPTENEGFQLSGTAAFIYSYLTVSHDNMNEAIKHDVDYTYGIRQMIPFNVILKIPALTEAIDNSSIYKVRDHLNTVNIIGYAYYDFGMIGVAVLMFIWAVIFGTIQAIFRKDQGVFSMLALGNTMTPVVLCFFAVWMSEFTLWMHWGMIFLMFMAANVTVPWKNKK